MLTNVRVKQQCQFNNGDTIIKRRVRIEISIDIQLSFITSWA